MPDVTVEPVGCRDGALSGFAVCVTAGSHTLVLLNGDGIQVMLHPSIEDTTSVRQDINSRISGYLATKQVTPIRLASVDLDDGTRLWAIRMLMFSDPEKQDGEPLFFLGVHTDAKGRLAPRLYHQPQAAMAAATEIAEIIAGGDGAIQWTNVKISEYSVG